MPSKRIFAVGESKVESGESEETTIFNGIVTVGVLGEVAGLRRELKVARPARCHAKERSIYSIILEAKKSSEQWELGVQYLLGKYKVGVNLLYPKIVEIRSVRYAAKGSEFRG